MLIPSMHFSSRPGGWSSAVAWCELRLGSEDGLGKVGRILDQLANQCRPYRPLASYMQHQISSKIANKTLGTYGGKEQTSSSLQNKAKCTPQNTFRPNQKDIKRQAKPKNEQNQRANRQTAAVRLPSGCITRGHPTTWAMASKSHWGSLAVR